MKSLNVGIIGCGRRIRDMLGCMQAFGIPFRLAAVADPEGEALKPLLQGMVDEATAWHGTADTLVRAAGLDGVMIGTRCNTHAGLACAVEPMQVPLFLEKPVALSESQLEELAARYAAHKAPVIVSFPLRLTPVAQEVKRILDSGALGKVAHVAAFNDVPYGDVYFHDEGYRDWEVTGGLWLQKATHDLDILNWLLGRRPVRVAAMTARHVFGGSRPYGLKCAACGEAETCPEGPFQNHVRRFQGETVVVPAERCCVFSEGIRNEDTASCLVEYSGGIQASYTQNFFIKHKAARRGARICGSEATLEFDWYANEIRVFSHGTPTQTEVRFGEKVHHFGGDRELALDFLKAMRDQYPGRSPLEAGIQSAALCLAARDSSENGSFAFVRDFSKKIS